MNESRPNYELFGELSNRHWVVDAYVQKILHLDPVYVSVPFVVWLAPDIYMELVGIASIIGYRVLQYFIELPIGSSKIDEEETQATLES